MLVVATRAKKCLWQPGPKKFVATRACADMTLCGDAHRDVKRDMYRDGCRDVHCDVKRDVL